MKYKRFIRAAIQELLQVAKPTTGSTLPFKGASALLCAAMQH